MDSQLPPLEQRSSPLRVVNIVAKTHILAPSRSSLAHFLASRPFANPSSSLRYLPIHHPCLPVKFSIFSTGSVVSRASRSLPETESAFAWLRSFLSPFELQLADEFSVLNIVAVSRCFSSSFDLSKLALFLPHCSYDPSPNLCSSRESFLNAIVLRLSIDSNARRGKTALIFPTGYVTFTGFTSLSDLEFHAGYLSSLLLQVSFDHPEVCGPRRSTVHGST